MQKKRLNPLTITNKKIGNNKGKITPRHENSLILYFNEINNIDCAPVMKHNEKELYEKYKAGCQKSKETLIKSNLRFVVSVAKHYQNQGLPFEDLVNEGNYGLMVALDKFDPSRNIKFFSYAVWWIRQSILQSLVENGKMVRIPVNKKDSLQRVNKKISELEQKLQRKPTTDEIVEAIDDLDDDTGKKTTKEDIGNILRSNLTQISLDAPFIGTNGDEEGTLNDRLPGYSYHEKSKTENVLTEIEIILNPLSEMERNIIQMHYGVLSDRKYTLEEIGAAFNLTRERIRQIELKAIQRLRNNPKIHELLEYLTEE